MNQTHMLYGFNGYFSTEALEGTLPKKQNAPQKVAHGLYAEQISGSAFTALRHQNFKSWLYRIRPSVLHCNEFEAITHPYLLSSADPLNTPPTQLRWNPPPFPESPTDFLDGWFTLAANGSASSQDGASLHLYTANTSMKRYFYNADGDLLIIPQEGRLHIKTELGQFTLQPTEIAVIQRGIRFQVDLLDTTARGYLCENHGAPFTLPERGPIGANGLAEERHFEIPCAAYEDKEGPFELVAKFNQQLWATTLSHSPLDVVAWQGNHAPYKYDLTLFCPMGNVSFDHADPSIFTVLTSPSTKQPGLANLDFVIFPERWMVAENTFRPPYFHRNIMSEYMGLIRGQYDGKADGFLPGGGSLHNCMSGHGVDAATFEAATHAELSPQRYESTLAFMLESQYIWQTTQHALDASFRQKDYLQCWKTLSSHFTPPNR